MRLWEILRDIDKGVIAHGTQFKATNLPISLEIEYDECLKGLKYVGGKDLKGLKYVDDEKPITLQGEIDCDYDIIQQDIFFETCISADGETINVGDNISLILNGFVGASKYHNDCTLVKCILSDDKMVVIRTKEGMNLNICLKDIIKITKEENNENNTK